jgi:hypothetical protein
MHLLKGMGGGAAAAKPGAPSAKSSYFSSLKLEYQLDKIVMTNLNKEEANKSRNQRSRCLLRALFHKNLH